MSLRTKLIRLAATRPDLRPQLLPLLKLGASERELLRPLDEFVERVGRVPGVTRAVLDDWATSSHSPTFIAAEATVYVYVDPKVSGRATNALKAVAARLEKEFNARWERESEQSGRIHHISSIDFWSPRADQGGPDVVPTRDNPREMGWERGQGREDELKRRLMDFYKRHPYTLNVSFTSDLLVPKSTSIWDDEAWEASGGRSHQATTKVALSQVGQVIVEQMGGVRRLSLMLGIGTGPSYQFYDVPQGVGFAWPNKQRSRGNCVEVRLDPDDTYTVTFYNLAGGEKKKVKELDDIYADQLVEVFEAQTGWHLRL